MRVISPTTGKTVLGLAKVMGRFNLVVTGADPGFQVRGGALKKIAPIGGRREIVWGISCEKSRFYANKSYFFQLRREARKCRGISCDKSRFYAKKSNFFQFPEYHWLAGVKHVIYHLFGMYLEK
jgi:hypothetical protein